LSSLFLIGLSEVSRNAPILCPISRTDRPIFNEKGSRERLNDERAHMDPPDVGGSILTLALDVNSQRG
jgi:hypothetical protein